MPSRTCSAPVWCASSAWALFRRLVFYSTTTGYAGGTERHVVSKLVMTAEVMQQIAVLLFADHPDKVLDEVTAARAAAH